MGLVQRAIEAAGFTTVIISTIPDLTASVSVPRLVAVGHPQGRTMGMPGDEERQQAVLLAALQAVTGMSAPGGRVDLQFDWSETPAKARAPAVPPPPIATYLQQHPWQLPNLMNRNVPKEA